MGTIKILRTAFAVSIFLISLSAGAHGQGIPHVFSNGEIIDANEVNANYQFLLDQMGGRTFVRANGVIIGTSFIPSGPLSIINVFPINIQSINIYQIDKSGRLRFGFTYYKTSNCMGTPYASAAGTFIFLSKIILHDTDGQLFYWDNSQGIRVINTGSVWSNSSNKCSLSSNISFSTVKLVANNPVVTGISTYPFPTPITLDGISEASVTVEP